MRAFMSEPHPAGCIYCHVLGQLGAEGERETPGGPAYDEAARILAETEPQWAEGENVPLFVVRGRKPEPPYSGGWFPLHRIDEYRGALRESLTAALASWPESCGRRWNDAGPEDRTPRAGRP